MPCQSRDLVEHVAGHRGPGRLEGVMHVFGIGERVRPEEPVWCLGGRRRVGGGGRGLREGGEQRAELRGHRRGSRMEGRALEVRRLDLHRVPGVGEDRRHLFERGGEARADRLGRTRVRVAIGELDERQDGRGGPRGLAKRREVLRRRDPLHAREPEQLGDLLEVANAVAHATPRPGIGPGEELRRGAQARRQAALDEGPRRWRHRQVQQDRQRRRQPHEQPGIQHRARRQIADGQPAQGVEPVADDEHEGAGQLADDAGRAHEQHDNREEREAHHLPVRVIDDPDRHGQDDAEADREQDRQRDGEDHAPRAVGHVHEEDEVHGERELRGKLVDLADQGRRRADDADANREFQATWRRLEDQPGELGPAGPPLSGSSRHA